MLKKFLCFIGWHDWVQISPGWLKHARKVRQVRKCKHCGGQEYYRNGWLGHGWY